MIGRLSGKLVDCSPTSVLLDVRGVGYELTIPLSTFYTLAGGGNGTVSLFVHTRLREDALQLFGFATLEERAAFQQFLAVSGVGPRLALAVLSGIGVDELERAVLEGDRVRLERIPGIGRKTAERLILELKDRLRRRRRTRSGTAGQGPPGSAGDPLRDDAVSALVNLGYTPEGAQRAVEAALGRIGDGATLERVLKESLGALVQRSTAR